MTPNLGVDPRAAIEDYYMRNMSVANQQQPPTASAAPNQPASSKSSNPFGGLMDMLGGGSNILPMLALGLIGNQMNKSGKVEGKKDWLTGLSFGGTPAGYNPGTQMVQQVMAQRQQQAAAQEKQRREMEMKMMESQLKQEEESQKFTLNVLKEIAKEDPTHMNNSAFIEAARTGDPGKLLSVAATLSPKISSILNEVALDAFAKLEVGEPLTDWEWRILGEEGIAPKGMTEAEIAANQWRGEKLVVDSYYKQMSLDQRAKIEQAKLAAAWDRTAASIWARREEGRLNRDARRANLEYTAAQKEILQKQKEGGKQLTLKPWALIDPSTGETKFVPHAVETMQYNGRESLAYVPWGDNGELMKNPDATVYIVTKGNSPQGGDAKLAQFLGQKGSGEQSDRLGVTPVPISVYMEMKSKRVEAAKPEAEKNILQRLGGNIAGYLGFGSSGSGKTTIVPNQFPADPATAPVPTATVPSVEDEIWGELEEEEGNGWPDFEY
jgi:hypothetical protein